MEDHKEFSALLSKHQLKKTATRLSVLQVLKSRKAAVSQPDLEEVLGNEMDRVTLYRTLATFEEKGIIHKVLNLSGTANYALCSKLCTNHKHQDDHVHFNCTNCLNVYCLDSLSIPAINLPKGYLSHSLTLMVYGLCKKCSQTAL